MRLEKWDVLFVAKSSPGERLRELREARELSLRDLAAKSGLHRAAIHRMEHDTQPIGLDDILKLAPHLGVTAEEFGTDLIRATKRAERKGRAA